mmetsp:Transcript_57681/g.102323  ORF Transcript_57681/g.102323 Transcript_57681/m.102323 type:complete len:117 (+) Transcript_57681:161-511(+)
MAGKISISLHPRAPDAGEPDDPEMLEGMRLGLESYIANLEKTLLLPGEEMDALGMSAPAGSSSSSSAGPPPPPPPPPALPPEGPFSTLKPGTFFKPIFPTVWAGSQGTSGQPRMLL